MKNPSTQSTGEEGVESMYHCTYGASPERNQDVPLDDFISLLSKNLQMVNQAVSYGVNHLGIVAVREERSLLVLCSVVLRLWVHTALWSINWFLSLKTESAP